MCRGIFVPAQAAFALVGVRIACVYPHFVLVALGAVVYSPVALLWLQLRAR